MYASIKPDLVPSAPYLTNNEIPPSYNQSLIEDIINTKQFEKIILIDNPSEELCKMAILNNYNNFSFIKSPSTNICIMAFDLCPADKQQLFVKHNQHFTTDFYKYILTKYPQYVNYISTENLTNELCLIIATNENYNINNIPEKFITYEVCKKAIQHSNYNITKYIPKHFYCDDLFFNAKSINMVPEEYRTQTIYDHYVKKDMFNFKLIPEEFKTDELCDYVKDNYFEYTPKKYQINLIEKNFKYVYKLSSCYINQEIFDVFLKSYLNSNDSSVISNYVYRSTNWNISQENKEKLIIKNYENLKDIDQTEDICIFALHCNIDAFRYIRNYTTKIYEEALKINGLLIYNIPESQRTLNLWRIAVKQNNDVGKKMPLKYIFLLYNL
jgi:hypothetical protein